MKIPSWAACCESLLLSCYPVGQCIFLWLHRLVNCHYSSPSCRFAVWLPLQVKFWGNMRCVYSRLSRERWASLLVHNTSMPYLLRVARLSKRMECCHCVQATTPCGVEERRKLRCVYMCVVFILQNKIKKHNRTTPALSIQNIWTKLWAGWELSSARSHASHLQWRNSSNATKTIFAAERKQTSSKSHEGWEVTKRT